MWLFWVAAILPILVCGAFLVFNKNVSYVEWIITAVVSLAMAGLFQLIAGIGMTADVETWSGYATQTRQYSRWKEYYEYAVYRTEYYYTTETYYTTDSKGRRTSHTRRVRHSRRVFDHWEPTTRWHGPSWTLFTTLQDFNIDEGKFNYMCQKFNDHHPVPGRRTTSEHNSKMIDGDPNDYVADNKTGWIEPVTVTKHFENRVKAAPSLFSYSKVPTNIAVYPWPNNPNWNRSDRVMGEASRVIDTLKWDQMNAVLGPTKKVNVIIVGFGNQPLSMANYQEAKWIGGKKNDLVICYGEQKAEDGANSVRWVKVFGWTEANYVKHSLESVLLEHPINNDIIPLIEKEIREHYVIKDWHKFDYITIEPPTWSYWVYFIVMIITHAGLTIWYNKNDIDQHSDGSQKWSRSLQLYWKILRNRYFIVIGGIKGLFKH